MQYDNLIGGESVGGTYRPNVSPSDHGDTIGQYASATAADTEVAIDAAVSAKTAWKRVSTVERMRLLNTVGEALLAQSAELGETLSREEGKPLREGIAEAARAGSTFKYFAAQLLQPTGSVFNSHRPDTAVHVSHSPVGAVGIITPWNFPLAVPAWKIAPALAYGNTVVFKPAELVPASAWALTQIIREAGIPDGVFNLVMGRGSIVGDAIAGSSRLDAVSFTGSTEVGTAIALRSIENGNKRVQAEMGGKNSIIVLDDADLETAVAVIVDSAFSSTGQRCTATSRIIATPGIYSALVDGIRRRMLSLRVGHSLDPETDIGPVASESQLAQDLDYIRIGADEGAELVAGGALIDARTPGNFLQPTLFAGGTSRMRINQEEIFGPVACVIEVADLDEAIAVANDSRYGLSSGIITNSLSAITHFTDEIEAGIVAVNTPPANTELHVPFGGVKESGLGPREQGGYARDFYTTVSTRYITTVH